MPAEPFLDLPPHLDHWSLALCYILDQSAEAHSARWRWDVENAAWDAARDSDEEVPRPTNPRIFRDAQRILLRTHPLHMRFVASNSVSEEELVGMLLTVANAMRQASEALASIEWESERVLRLSGDSVLVEQVVRHGNKVLPSTFRLAPRLPPLGE